MKRKLKIWVGDLKSITPKTDIKNNNDTEMYLGGYIDLYENDETMIKIFKTIDEFMTMLKQEYASGICFFHNLNFDGDFIYKYFISKNVPCLDNHKVRKAGYHVQFVESQIYEIIYNFTSKTNGKTFFHKIYFKCCWRFLSNDLKSIGNNYEIDKKLENNEEKFYDNKVEGNYSDRFMQYLKNDITILKKALINFDKGLNSIKNQDKMKKWYNYEEKDITNLVSQLRKKEIRETQKKIYHNFIKRLETLNAEKNKLSKDFEDILAKGQKQNNLKKAVKITREINNEIDNYIEDLIINYDENTNGNKTQYLWNKFNWINIFTYKELLGYFNDDNFDWVVACIEGNKSLIDYLYSNVDNFKNFWEQAYDASISNDLYLSFLIREVLLLVFIEEQIKDWETTLEFQNRMEDGFIKWKEKIEKSISSFIGIDFKLNDCDIYYKNKEDKLVFITKNMLKIYEVYILDKDTFEVLEKTNLKLVKKRIIK